MHPAFRPFLYLMVAMLPRLAGIAQTAPAPYGPLPSPAQLRWQELEVYGIVHYGANTFTNREWGYGDESPALIRPRRFGASRVAAAAKAGGLRGLIVVAKHHDGLCLWPTRTTEHSIRHSPWRDGRGDVLAEFRRACDAHGLALGVYCSPWDRNSAVYGQPGYPALYRAQLTELYTTYGPFFISWHDGANGGEGFYGGARTERRIDRSTYYGWDSTWALTRRLQPSAVIFGDVGPDVRWVGNEAGRAGETCWATYTPRAPDSTRAPANGYTRYEEAQEGHRHGRQWMPAECDVPLRAGWFYHPGEDATTKSAAQLFDLYCQSVGRGACLNLGLAPDQNGRLSRGDVRSLKRFGNLVRHTFARNLAHGATFRPSNIRQNDPAQFGPAFLTDGDRYSYWATDDSVHTPELVVDLPRPARFNIIRLRENIRLGQRIERLSIEMWQNGQWQPLATATSIGANRLIRLPEAVKTRKLRVRILQSPACVTLSDFGLFLERGR